MGGSMKWAGAIVFLAVYGLAVFFGTRAYYTAQPESPATVNRSLPADHPGDVTRLRPFPLQPRSDDIASVMDLANSAFQNKEYATAARGYSRALELSPDNVDLYNNLGLTLFYLDRIDEALDKLNQGVAIDPQVPRIWLTLGFVQSNAQRTAEARRSLQKAIELDAESQIGKEARRMLDQIGQ